METADDEEFRQACSYDYQGSKDSAENVLTRLLILVGELSEKLEETSNQVNSLPQKVVSLLNLHGPPVMADGSADTPNHRAHTVWKHVPTTLSGTIRVEEDSTWRAPTANVYDTASLTSQDDSATEYPTTIMPTTLPENWPASLNVRKECVRVVAVSSGNNPAFLAPSTAPSSVPSWNEFDEETPPRRVSVHAVYSSLQALRDPMNTFHAGWGILGLIVLGYELTIVPWLLAWERPIVGLLTDVAIFCVSYWSIDIGVSCWKGFYKNGDLVRDQKAILKRYLRSWLLADIALVLLDWVTLPVWHFGNGSTTNVSKLLRFVKIGKVVRLLGLTKIIRAGKLVGWFVKHIIGHTKHVEEMRLAARIGWIIVATLWVNHLLSCIWFAIGTQLSWGEELTWVGTDAASRDKIIFLETPLAYQYLTALHWAIAQICLGSMEISASNAQERAYTVFCLVLGLLLGSWLISSLSASMVEFQIDHQDRNRQLRVLAQYLKDNDIPKRLSQELQRQAADRLSKPERLSKDDVTVLPLLSKDLQRRLHREICGPRILRHPLFRLAQNIDPLFIDSFCAGAVDILFYRKSDEIFAPDIDARHAYYVVVGTLSYVQEPTTAPVSEYLQETADPGTWLSEACLWCHWHHVGIASCVTSAHILTVSVVEMVAVLKPFSQVGKYIAHYCRLFHARVASAKPPQAPFPTDLSVPYTEFGDLVSMMSNQVRVDIAERCCATMGFKHRMLGHMQSGGMEELLDEVRDGKAVLVFDEDGNVERVLALAVLRIANDEGRILVQLGSRKKNRIVADCRLPAAKRKDNESIMSTINRLVTTKLNIQTEQLEFGQVKSEEQWETSKRFGLKTRYLRRVCSAAWLAGELNAVKCSVAVQRRQSSSSALRHEQSIFSRYELVPAIERFKCMDVYFIDSGEDYSSGAFFGWLDPADFVFLTKPSNEWILQSWLGLLAPYLEEASPAASRTPSIGGSIEVNRLSGRSSTSRTASPTQQAQQAQQLQQLKEASEATRRSNTNQSHTPTFSDFDASEDIITF